MDFATRFDQQSLDTGYSVQPITIDLPANGRHMYFQEYRSMRSLSIIFCCIVCALSSNAQAVDQGVAISNSRMLVLSLEMNKSSYFPGEGIQLRISLVNPTDRSLDVVTPFAAVSGGVNLFREYDAGKLTRRFSSMISHPLRPCGDCASLPISRIGAKQSLDVVLRLGEDEKVSSFLNWKDAIVDPGVYKFEYDYIGKRGNVTFTVIPATIARFVSWKFRTPLRVPILEYQEPTGRYREYARVSAIFVVASERKLYLAVSRQLAGEILLKPGDGLGSGNANLVAPYQIIDESFENIDNILVSSDEQELLSISYRVGTNTKAIRFDTKKMQIETVRK